MKKIDDGRWPAWLRSFRYRLVFFSSLTITVIIALFGIAVFTLFTLMELQRVDRVLSRASNEAMTYFENGKVFEPAAERNKPGFVVFQVYDEDLSLLFSAPPGSRTPAIPGALLTRPDTSGNHATLDTQRQRFLSRTWWVLPWNCLSVRDLWRVSISRATLSEKPVLLVTMIPLDPLLESRHLLFWMTALAGLAGIFFSLIVGKMVAGKAMKPLEEINRALSRVSIENMNIKVPPGETDREILEIVQHVKNMLQGLNQSVKNLQQFTSDAGHELRMPLAIMRGTVDVALLKERDSEYYIRKLQEIIYSIEDMQNLVGALLELARLDTIKGLDSKEPFDLLIVAEDSISNISPLIAKRGQTIKEKLEPAPTAGREAMILRLANNLLENASKHSPPGSFIGINTHLDTERKESVLEVWDHGPGLDPEEIRRCFDRFWRAEYSRTTPGFGLGLPLVQRIAQIHGAEIDIESRKGEGSLFRVRFPLDTEALKEYDFE
ncbi:MAG: HAMP domain-containing sensor histidine kinase [Thermovirgaceae bacterium]|nr:HAMP domain-containing sensor histidine kinase [Thermovirgaceae bacterium]